MSEISRDFASTSITSVFVCCRQQQTDVDVLKKCLVESGSIKLIDKCSSPESAVDQAYIELDKILRSVSFVLNLNLNFIAFDIALSRANSLSDALYKVSKFPAEKSSIQPWINSINVSLVATQRSLPYLPVPILHLGGVRPLSGWIKY